MLQILSAYKLKLFDFLELCMYIVLLCNLNNPLLRQLNFPYNFIQLSTPSCFSQLQRTYINQPAGLFNTRNNWSQL